MRLLRRLFVCTWRGHDEGRPGTFRYLRATYANSDYRIAPVHETLYVETPETSIRVWVHCLRCGRRRDVL